MTHKLPPCKDVTDSAFCNSPFGSGIGSSDIGSSDMDRYTANLGNHAALYNHLEASQGPLLSSKAQTHIPPHLKSQNPRGFGTFFMPHRFCLRLTLSRLSPLQNRQKGD